MRDVNGVSIGCRAIQPGTVIDRKPNATIGPQKHSQAPKPNGFFDSIGPSLTNRSTWRMSAIGLKAANQGKLY